MTTTLTQTEATSTIRVTGETSRAHSADLPLDLSKYPKLSPEQVGHLRHFHNLAFQPDGEWRHMGALEPGQEFLDAYRYQLATMAYASSLAHFHRLPALRTIFKPLLRQLIHKMLRRDVWDYWYNTSQGGIVTDPSLTELRKPWADPVVKENIMYSGHLLLMTSLYGMLFDDDEFEKDDSIVFKWDPIFWGFGPEEFKYSNRTLQKVILDDMEANGWLGSCCEPNVVFVVCNQFPLIAMRYNDVRDGTNLMDDILPKYTAAWAKKQGMVRNDTELFADWWMVKQDFVVPAQDLGFTAWAGAFMHSWNPSIVESHYPRQTFSFITHTPSGETRLQPPIVAKHYRAIAAEEPSAKEHEILQKAIAQTKAELAASKGPGFPYTKPIFGYVTQWLSELGAKADLESLLAYADTNLRPEWENGGLYYPRNDKRFELGEDDDTVKWTFMATYTGNAAIGYSRLNVQDGQRIMYERPWTSGHLATTPWIDNLHFVREKHGVSVLRGQWDADVNALILTVRGWDYIGKGCEEQVTISPVARKLGPGRWALYVRGKLVVARDLTKTDDGFEATVSVRRGEEVDVVFLKA